MPAVRGAKPVWPLWARAVVAMLALPGIVALAVPLMLRGEATPSPAARLPGVGLLLMGSALLGACVRELHVAGRGTLAPWSPPVQLVSSGPYRYSRNPMYVGVLLILAGWATLYASATLTVYAAGVALAFQLRVTRAEEPALARAFGDAWRDYRTGVPRWIGRRRADAT
jgi:protein-S-isoprenylcysteine O-methyltransferase Ste14